MSRRIGNFTIDRALFQDCPGAVMALMGRVIVIRCEYLYEQDLFEYTAISPEFTEVAKGCMAPRYTVVIDKDAVGNDRFVGFE